jgi:hypothetical protein
MTDSPAPPLAAGQIEIWKKIVDVQQHFNDLELRIRNFALIVTGAFLGLGGYAIKDGGIINAFGWEVSMAGLIVVSAIFPLLAFYFMDRLWYHRLLDGSVQAGIEAETALKDLGYKVDLGSQISAKSPFKLWVVGKLIHSKTKMDIFYLVLVLTLLIVGACLGFGIRPQPVSATPAISSSADSAHVPSPSPTKPIVPGAPIDPAVANATAAADTNIKSK